MRPTRLLVIAACFVSGAVSFACSDSGAPPVPPASTVPAPMVVRTVEDIPPELQAVIDELPNIKSSRTDVTVEFNGKVRDAGYIEFEAPDRLRLTVSPDRLAEPNYVLIGYEYFLRIGRDWFARSFEPLPTPDPLVTVTPVPGFELRVFRGGTATVEGKKCELYAFPVSADVQSDLVAASTLQVCIADNRLQRIVWKGGARTITAIIHYDLPVNIARPE